jgi:hypothetical protein
MGQVIELLLHKHEALNSNPSLSTTTTTTTTTNKTFTLQLGM